MSITSELKPGTLVRALRTISTKGGLMLFKGDITVTDSVFLDDGSAFITVHAKRVEGFKEGQKNYPYRVSVRKRDLEVVELPVCVCCNGQLNESNVSSERIKVANYTIHTCDRCEYNCQYSFVFKLWVHIGAREI